jgi:hypothetical protein
MFKQFKLVVLFLTIALLGVVSVASAQGNIDINTFINRLGPNASRAVPPLLSYLLYAVFVMSAVTMVVVPDKQSTLSFLMIGVMIAAFLAKVQFFYICGLVTLVLNVIMFVVPLIVGGMSRGIPGKPPRSLGMGIFTGILGGAYFFLFWAQVQTTACPAVGNVDQLFGPFL